MSEPCFQLKGSVVTVVVLELRHYSTAAFAAELQLKIEQAPQLLRDSPVVITFDRYHGDPALVDFPALVALCRDQGVQPLGIRGDARFTEAARHAGLAILPAATGRDTGPRAGRAKTGATAGREPAAAAPEHRATRLVTTPVRSGQQVYARNADLIVMSQVSEGAEVLADGNIHIYGGLRGRALAGVNGNEAARIFCHKLDAELLAVAGNFLLSEDVPREHWKQSVQVYLEGDRLTIQPLS